MYSLKDYDLYQCRMSQQNGSSTEKVSAQVKWFNSKAGYGFLTVTDGDKKGTDVFVHHSQVIVSEEQYRYLVQGEYVQFEWVEAGGKSRSSDHPYQAGNVVGVNGGKLMCETRNAHRPPMQGAPRPQRRSDHPGNARPRPRGASVSEGDAEDGGGWTTKHSRRKSSKRYQDSDSQTN